MKQVMGLEWHTNIRRINSIALTRADVIRICLRVDYNVNMMKA